MVLNSLEFRIQSFDAWTNAIARAAVGDYIVLLQGRRGDGVPVATGQFMELVLVDVVDLKLAVRWSKRT